MKHLLYPILLISLTIHSQNILIKNANIIDVKTGKVLKNTDVLIGQNRIRSVGKGLKANSNGVVIDATNKYLIPGLWDMHAHTLTDKRYEYSFPLLIANGVTGVREMANNLSIANVNRIRKEVEEGEMLGPRFGALTYHFLDGPGTQFGVAIAVSSPDSARLMVQEYKQAGADFIKVYNLLSREVYLAIVDEARKQKIPVEGHVPFSMTAAEVSNLGQKTIEHDFDILVSCSKNESELRKNISQQTWGQAEAKAAVTYDEQKAKKLFDLFVHKGTWMCPTIAFYKPVWWIADENEVLKDSLLRYIPKSQVDGWHTPFQRLSHNTIEEYRKKHYEMRSRIVKEMHDAGVNILAGTDTGSPFSLPGFSLHDELQALVDAGLSTIEALKAATLNPAKFLGKENDFGTVEKGKIADLVLLDANPLENIGNTKKIFAVIANGKLLERKNLDQMLDDVKQQVAK
jgi:imidazolonepropionase-like amidohydrolase